MNHLLENWQNKKKVKHKNGILTTKSPKKTFQIQKKKGKQKQTKKQQQEV
jgi:hypothetical protein